MHMGGEDDVSAQAEGGGQQAAPQMLKLGVEGGEGGEQEQSRPQEVMGCERTV